MFHRRIWLPTSLDTTDYERLFGLYTDKPSYGPGETISVYANWPNGSHVKYRVLRYGNLGGPAYWEEVRSLGTQRDYSHIQGPPYGSFIEFPSGPSLSGRSSFTLEGWILPTWTTGQQVILAGQADKNGGGIAAIGIDSTGHLNAFVRNASSSIVVTTDSATLTNNGWYYVGVTFDGLTLRLYKGQEGSCLPLPVATAAFSSSGSALTSTSFAFRMGGSTDAPGIGTGCYDGRLDRWSVWDSTLTRKQLQKAMNNGMDSTNFCSTSSLPTSGRLVFVDFEDAYGDTLANTANSGAPGYLHGHGTPGVSGRKSGRAVRLNYDQVVDAHFETLDATEMGGTPQAAPVEEIAIPCSGWGTRGSGLFVVQAVRQESGSYDPASTENQEPSHFASFAVRPSTCAESPEDIAPIAVVVPVSTWVAYNAWPGTNGDAFYAGESAPGLSARAVPSNTSLKLPQGDNSAYQSMGDGLSPCCYVGWLRPTLASSPIESSGDFADVQMDIKLIEWLEHPLGSASPYDYDAYTDWDLDDGNLALLDGNGAPRYSAVMFIGHNEYWSRNMLDNLHAYLNAGGSVINLAGNTLAWRVTLSPDEKIMEVRKWVPSTCLVGDLDVFGLIDAPTPPASQTPALMGAWRLLEQCQTSQPADDYVLGTSADVVGSNDSSEYGYWRVEGEHWLWNNLSTCTSACGPSVGTCLTGLGQIVGGEADAYVEDRAICSSSGSGPTTLPSTFPFGSSGVEILARGAFPSVTWGVANWGHPVFDQTTFANERAQTSPTNLFCNSSFGSDSDTCSADHGTHGMIVYYKHDGGGRVLNIASIVTARGLRPSGGATELSDLVARALDCMTSPSSSTCGDY